MRAARSHVPEPEACAMKAHGWAPPLPELPSPLPATPPTLLSPPPLTLSIEGLGEPPTMEPPDDTISSCREPGGVQAPIFMVAAVASADAAGTT